MKEISSSIPHRAIVPLSVSFGALCLAVCCFGVVALLQPIADPVVFWELFHGFDGPFLDFLYKFLVWLWVVPELPYEFLMIGGILPVLLLELLTFFRKSQREPLDAAFGRLCFIVSEFGAVSMSMIYFIDNDTILFLHSPEYVVILWYTLPYILLAIAGGIYWRFTKASGPLGIALRWQSMLLGIFAAVMVLVLWVPFLQELLKFHSTVLWLSLWMSPHGLLVIGTVIIYWRYRKANNKQQQMASSTTK